MKIEILSLFLLSPSSRRAWIEIFYCVLLPQLRQVALLAEGVDRNENATASANGKVVALLAEGVDRNKKLSHKGENKRVALLAEGVDRNRFAEEDERRELVALLAEGVDRNNPGFRQASHAIRRPPRGGRG